MRVTTKHQSSLTSVPNPGFIAEVDRSRYKIRLGAGDAGASLMPSGTNPSLRWNAGSWDMDWLAKLGRLMRGGWCHGRSRQTVIEAGRTCYFRCCRQNRQLTRTL